MFWGGDERKNGFPHVFDDLTKCNDETFSGRNRHRNKRKREKLAPAQLTTAFNSLLFVIYLMLMNMEGKLILNAIVVS